MEIKNILYRKEMKLITLLLTSLLIASASAAVYYSMIAQPNVTVSVGSIIFVQGADWPTTGSTMGTNSTWARLALKAYPNATLTYDKPLNVSNTTGSAHLFRLRHVSITPASGNTVSNFTFVNFVVKNTAGTSQASFNYTTSGDTWTTPATTSYLSLPANTQWIIYVETKATAGANTDIVADIQIAIDVQE